MATKKPTITPEDLDRAEDLLSSRQLECLKAYIDLGSMRKAAALLGADRLTVRSAVDLCTRAGLLHTAVPVSNAPGFETSKTTVQYDAEGNVVNEWRRQVPALADLDRAAQAIIDEAKGAVPRLRKPRRKAKSEIMLELPIMDLHISKQSWPAETHDVYDTSIAAKLATSAVQTTLAEAGPVEKVAIVFGGDTLHADNIAAVTERSGHALDVDTRYAKTVRVASRLLHTAVRLCYEHCGNVEVVVIQGNHDLQSALWLREVLAAAYEKTSGVVIRTDPYPRQYLEYGVNLIGFAHGDRVPISRLLQVMPVEQPEMWARTKYRYWHAGHIHRSKRVAPIEIDEHQGITVEYLRSLCAPDAWHVESGYVGTARALTSYLWHAKYGPRGTIIRSAEELAELTA